MVKRTSIMAAIMLCLSTAVVVAQSSMSAEEVLEKSVAYHGMAPWWEHHHRLTLTETRPNGNDRATIIDIDNVIGRFALRSERGEDVVEGSVQGDECTATVNGSEDIPDDLRERYRLSCDGIQWWRSYYGYLYGLPMKLQDAGTMLDDEVRHTTFQDRDVLALRVTYEAEVGADTWYFYLDPSSFALVGYRFYHDESKNDGEYIVLEGEVEHDGVRLPKRRAWYTNAEDKFLGADIIEAYVHVPPDGQ